MHRIKIISDGIAHNTKILNQDGTPIEGVTSVTISTIKPESTVDAILTFDCVQLEIQADWANHPLKKWADKKVGRTV
ncbi:MAG: hypothetical protein KZQ84_10745 [Candidatus Thiodiazotropha sp. (ex Lucinoma borealis)]|nr:hypothetical protein [Candidatus Thiodiazotropha sp. (ex Lucinoma borealis)]